jgi:hypothetical protein
LLVANALFQAWKDLSRLSRSSLTFEPHAWTSSRSLVSFRSGVGMRTEGIFIFW